MRLKLTFFLILLNVALFSYIVFLESADRGENPELSRLILSEAVTAAPTGLSLEGSAVQAPWNLQREGDRWWIESPVQWPANPFAVHRLLDLLRFLRWETRFPVDTLDRVGKSLADYGLDEAATVLAIRHGETVTRLRLGQPTEIGNRLYLLSPDEREIFVVQSELLRGVQFDIESLLNRALIEIPAFEARGFNLAIGTTNPVRVQVARENDRWVFNAPIRVAADDDKVNQALEALHQTPLTTFSEADASTTGLGSPALRLNLNGNGRQQTLLLGNIVDPDAVPLLRYARLEGRTATLTVPAAPFEVWFEAQESLRQRRFMEFAPEDVGSVEIRFDEQSLTLQRLESGSWQLIQSRGGNLTTEPADTTLLASLFHRLASLEAQRFVTDAPSTSDLDRFGFNDPQRRLTLRLQNGERRTLLLGNFITEEIGERRHNRIYAKRETAPSVYLTTASILADFPLDPLHYRERLVGSLPSGATITALRLLDRNTETRLLDLSRPENATWEDALTPLDPTRRAAAGALLSAYRRFEIDRFVADFFADPFPLDADNTLPWRYVVEADLRLPGTTTPDTRRYFLAERRGGMTQFAGAPAANLTFTLRQPLIDALHPLLTAGPRPDAEVNPNPVEPALPEPTE